MDQVIGYISQFKTASWTTLAEQIPSLSSVIEKASTEIIHMNNFVAGINIAESPGFRISVYMIIPIAAAFFQWLSIKTMSAGNNNDDNPAASMTKNMNIMMPLMSFVMCFSFPSGIGIYWAASALFRVLQQLAINHHINNMDMEALIAKNMEKASKKKKKPSMTQKMMEKVGMEGKNQPAGEGSITNAAKTNTKNYSKNYDNGKNADEISYSSNQSGKPKPGSMAEKAGLVREYNERNKKGGSR
jgi:YidC/Oxa1 family membrane protein insertase